MDRKIDKGSKEREEVNKFQEVVREGNMENLESMESGEEGGEVDVILPDFGAKNSLILRLLFVNWKLLLLFF